MRIGTSGLIFFAWKVRFDVEYTFYVGRIFFVKKIELTGTEPLNKEAVLHTEKPQEAWMWRIR